MTDTAQETRGAEATTPDAPKAARPRLPAILTRFGTSLVLVVLDLWSKALIFERLPGAEGLARDAHGHERLPLVGDWLALMLSLNKGAAFGFGGDAPHLLVGGRILAAVFIGVMLVRTGPGRRVFTGSLCLILAGALGNLYDNLFLEAPGDGHPYGAVRDFIDVYFGVWDWHFPTFNVADSCITCGAVLLLLSGFMPEGRTEGGPR